MTDELIKEVDEALAREKTSETWKKVSPFVYGGIALLVGGVGLQQFLEYQHNNKIEAQAAIFNEASIAFEAGDVGAAREKFKEVASANGGFAVLSNHMLADLEIKDGDPDAAVESYKAAAANREDVMGRIALLKAAYLKADTSDRAALEILVAPLLDKSDSVSALARELLAARSYADGDVERARREYRDLTVALDVPQQMVTRVRQTLLALPSPAVQTDAEVGKAILVDENAPEGATNP